MHRNDRIFPQWAKEKKFLPVWKLFLSVLLLTLLIPGAAQAAGDDPADVTFDGLAYCRHCASK